jgi:glycosyltransferase involved in cell wall biosynthesis
MPKVSIIVPVYNIESYVKDCLMSIKSQSFKDFEVIVVNDGSTDSSLSVVEEVVSGDSRFKVISQENGGLSVARNTGVNNATGVYVTFLDSDDMFSDGALSLAANLCDKKDLDMLIYGTDVFHDDSVVTNQKFNYERPSSLIGEIVTGRVFFGTSVAENKYSPSACMYWLKSSIAKKHQFLPGITHEDNLYTTQILVGDDCNVLQLVENPVYLRRVRNGSIMMAKPSPKNYLGYLRVFHMLKYEKGILDTNTQKALSKFRSSLFVNFVRVLVLVYGRRIPIGMRLEIYKCWKGNWACLFRPKSLLLSLMPVLVMYINDKVMKVFIR